MQLSDMFDRMILFELQMFNIDREAPEVRFRRDRRLRSAADPPATPCQ